MTLRYAIRLHAHDPVSWSYLGVVMEVGRIFLLMPCNREAMLKDDFPSPVQLNSKYWEFSDTIRFINPYHMIFLCTRTLETVEETGFLFYIFYFLGIKVKSNVHIGVILIYACALYRLRTACIINGPAPPKSSAGLKCFFSSFLDSRRRIWDGRKLFCDRPRNKGNFQWIYFIDLCNTVQKISGSSMVLARLPSITIPPPPFNMPFRINP